MEVEELEIRYDNERLDWKPWARLGGRPKSKLQFWVRLPKVMASSLGVRGLFWKCHYCVSWWGLRVAIRILFRVGSIVL